MKWLRQLLGRASYQLAHIEVDDIDTAVWIRRRAKVAHPDPTNQQILTIIEHIRRGDYDRKRARIDVVWVFVWPTKEQVGREPAPITAMFVADRVASKVTGYAHGGAQTMYTVEGGTVWIGRPA